MHGYLARRDYRQSGFALELYPHLAVSGNRFGDGARLRYGADFRLRFGRDPPQMRRLGLIQLCFPQASGEAHGRAGPWSVDKRAADPAPLPLARCLYGGQDARVGAHSAYYAGQPVRGIGATECSLIGTPRACVAVAAGRIDGETVTRFANYLVDLDGGSVYDQGIVWGYRVLQDAAYPARLCMDVAAPADCRLSGSVAQQDALARFLGMRRAAVARWVR